MNKKIALTVIITALISFFGVYYGYAMQNPTSSYKSPLTITTQSGETHSFIVELALTPEEQQTGLMYRKTMEENQGMLFVFKTSDLQSFWMKNTILPLDIFYISETGRINQIYKMTTPFSTNPLPSNDPAIAVLEINGGLSDKFGIKAGDIVQHAIFHNKDAQ